MELRQEVPEINYFKVEEVGVLMIHIGGYPGKYTNMAKQAMAMHGPQLFISGHSHILKVMYDEQNQCLHINPGAAGVQGWHKVRTLVRLTIDGKAMKNCEVIELGKRNPGG
jgi:predicted phosphodiesterase